MSRLNSNFGRFGRLPSSSEDPLAAHDFTAGALSMLEKGDTVLDHFVIPESVVKAGADNVRMQAEIVVNIGGPVRIERPVQ